MPLVPSTNPWVLSGTHAAKQSTQHAIMHSLSVVVKVVLWWAISGIFIQWFCLGKKLMR